MSARRYDRVRMRARSIVMALVLVRAVTATAVTIDDLPVESVYTLGRIRIEGTDTISPKAVRAVMQTRLPPWYTPWKRWLDPPIFNPNVFRADLQRIAAWLRESGHYAAIVQHDLVVEGTRVTIVITIDEGPVVHVRSVDLEVTDFVPTASEDAALHAEIPLEPDVPFTQAEYDAGHDRLEHWLQRRGFAYAKVEKSAVVDTRSNEVAVRYRVTRGIAAVFGNADVAGTAKVAVRLVRREIAFREGEPYNPDKLDETQARIFGLRLFRSVLVRPQNLAAASGVVDVGITVVEGPPRELVAGIGYGLEDEVRGQLRWQHNDFFGGGRQLGFRLKGSAIEQAIEGEFRQPYFLHPQQTFIAPLTQLRDDEPGFTVARLRFAPRVERKLRPQLTVAAGYNIEYDDLSDVPRSTIARFEGGRAGYEPRGIVSSLTGVVERNTTVDLLDPHEGSVVNLTLEQAGGPWQGRYSFYTAVLDAKKYFPLPGKRTLAGRVRLGAGDAFGQSDDVPLFRRFFAGGINSTRGYDRHLVGPLNDDEKPVGGRTLLEASIEFRTPIYGPFGGVVFFDAGEVRRQAASLTVGDLKFGTGVGVRYQTIVGPLRVDFGIPLEPPPGEPHWQIHFSIGQAF
jgi:outer membrane protein assembly complex protein YaeT